MIQVFLHLIQLGKKSLIKAQIAQPAKKTKNIESYFQNIYVLRGDLFWKNKPWYIFDPASKWYNNLTSV